MMAVKTKSKVKKPLDIKVKLPEPTEQEIVEVSQTQLKKALKELMTNNETKRSSILEELYDAHDQFNQEYFFGELSFPLITFDRMDNRTLGSYTHGSDAMGIENHIRFNVNFIALNPMSRVLETLKHEMIHQWQDEVLYYKKGTKEKKIRIQMVDEKGKVQTVSVDQKPYPADTHNKDFKDMAKVVGIPAEGDKCYGNPAKMPEAKSYNRKYQCACVASNGYRVSIWSTQPVNGKCLRCGKPYVEVQKDRDNRTGGTIEMKRSHVEQPGQDAIKDAMEAKGFTHFEKFKKRADLLTFVDDLEAEGIKFQAVENGFYEANHNAHKEGFTRWIAYTPVVKAKPSEAPSKKVDKKPAKKDTKKKEPKVEPVVEVPKKTEPKTPKKPAVKKPAKKKAEEPKVEAPVIETPPAVEPKENEPMGNVIEFKPKEEPAVEVPGKREYEYTNAQDLLDLYKSLGTVKAVADYFGMTSPNIIYHAKKNGVNFKKGVIEDGSK